MINVVELIRYYIMGVCLCEWFNEGVLLQIGNAVSDDESFQVDVRSWWNIHIDLLVAVVYTPGKHWCVHSSIAGSKYVKRIRCPAWPKWVELKEKTQQILVVWNIILGQIDISLSIWKPNPGRIINKKKASVACPSIWKFC